MKRAGGPAFLLAILSTVACTKATNDNPFMPPPTNGGTSGHVPSGTVVVDILTPQPGQSVGRGSLIDISATIGIEGGSDFVDGTSVKVVVTKKGTNQSVSTGALVLSSTAGTYAGKVSIGELDSGTYTLTVTASSSNGAMGSDAVDFDVDAGPEITVTSPVAGKSYKRTLTVEIVVTDPFGLAALPDAKIGYIPVPMADAGVPDTYRGMIDFDQPIGPTGMVEPPLFGDQLLTVSAINANGKRTEVQVVFTIDNDGPIVTDTHPTPGEIVGGIVLVSATVADGAGVLDSSLIAVIADETGTPLFELPLKPRGASVYSAYFDSARLGKCPEPPRAGPCVVYPTVSFRASDTVGNETVVGYEFTLDNVAPVSDLDSEDVRFFRKDGYCSRAFDPLALNRHIGDMPNDGAVVPQVFDLRARIQDDGNTPIGIKQVPVAGINPNATDVYILDDTNYQPLVVDTDGDGTCDLINPNLIPTTTPPTQNDQVLKVRLAGVPKQGTPDYRTDTNPPLATICSYPPAAVTPDYLCDFTQPYATITYAHGSPAIWSVEPITAAWCMGSQFDTFGNNIKEGWACLAVQSTDFAGNTSVSPPLRVYIKYDGAGAGNPAPANLGTPPSCAGVYNKMTGAITPGTCRARRFDQVSYCYEGDC